MSPITRFAIGLLAGSLLGVIIFWGRERWGHSALGVPAPLDVRFPAKGSQALDFNLKSLEGRDVALSDYRGQVVMLNFWATWCSPCKLEMPIFNRYAQEFNSEMVVLGVNMQEEASVVQEFVQSQGIQYPILLDGSAEVARLYQVTGLPTTYLFDEQGVIFAVHVGYMSEAQLVGYLQALGLLP